MVFDFIFDKNINNLEQISKILITKRSLALLTTKNFNLAANFLSNFLRSKHHSDASVYTKKTNLEYVLTFLSSFFAASSSLQFSCSFSPKFGSNFKSKQSVFSFPPTLQFNAVHYLQNLYACGLHVELEVQKSYFKFLTILLDYTNSLKQAPVAELDCCDLETKTLIDNLMIRFDCFVISFLDIDWELNDLKFVRDSNIIAYLIKNASKCMPIDYFKSDKGLTPSQVLEDTFRLSKEKFNESLNATSVSSSALSGKNSEFPSANRVSKLSSLEEEPSTTKAEDTAEDNADTSEKNEANSKLVFLIHFIAKVTKTRNMLETFI